MVFALHSDLQASFYLLKHKQYIATSTCLYIRWSRGWKGARLQLHIEPRPLSTENIGKSYPLAQAVKVCSRFFYLLLCCSDKTLTKDLHFSNFKSSKTLLRIAEYQMQIVYLFMQEERRRYNYKIKAKLKPSRIRSLVSDVLPLFTIFWALRT